MKIIYLALLSVVAAVAGVSAAEPTYWPQEALDKFGAFTITDGSSYFTFSRDGKFKSGPMGLSGRELNGTWTVADKTEMTVIARVGWMNGHQPQDDYRRIVLSISSLRKRERATQPTVSFGAPADLFDGYFYIEEFVKIPKPKDANSTR
jgi:hypothetical protein